MDVKPVGIFTNETRFEFYVHSASLGSRFGPYSTFGIALTASRKCDEIVAVPVGCPPPGERGQPAPAAPPVETVAPPEAKPGPELTKEGSKHYEAVICADCHLQLRVAETEDGRRLWVEPCEECLLDAEEVGYGRAADDEDAL